MHIVVYAVLNYSRCEVTLMVPQNGASEVLARFRREATRLPALS